MLTIVRRWLWTLVLRAFDLVSDARWIALSILLAIVGVAGIWLRLARWLTAGLSVLSVVLLVNDIRARAARLRAIQFPSRAGDLYEDVAHALELSTRFEMINAEHGRVVIDRVATSAISAGTVRVRLSAASYRLPRELRDAGSTWRRRRVAEGPTYNGSVTGLNTNVGLGPTLEATEWELVPAHYWDHLASDMLAARDIRIDGRLESGRKLYVDHQGLLRDFGESWLLNAIGTSVLAITTDLRLVAVVQSENNESSGGLLAPSGSGSLEPRDVLAADTPSLDTIAAQGAFREMQEEAAVSPHEVASTSFLGFGRWLEKSAKPELFTLAFLTIDSHEVHRRRVPSADRPYTLGVDLVRLNPIHEWDLLQPRTVLAQDSWTRLSVPLVACLHLLMTATCSSGSIAGDAIRRKLGPGG